MIDVGATPCRPYAIIRICNGGDGSYPNDRCRERSRGRTRSRTRPLLQILADRSGDLPAARDRPLPTDLFGDRQLPADYHAGGGLFVCRLRQLRAALWRRAAVAGAAAYGDHYGGGGPPPAGLWGGG